MTSEELAWKIKHYDVEMTHISHGSHIGAVLSISDIIAVLYTNILNIDPQGPKKADRDRLILSKSHAGAAIYAAFAEKGFSPTGELATRYGDGSHLSGHVSHKGMPGVEFSTGSSERGLPVAIGMTLKAEMERKDYQVYIVVGDGECDEGSIWGASMPVYHRRLGNLTVVVGCNKMQSLTFCEDTLSLAPLDRKFENFGHSVLGVDRHNHDELKKAFHMTFTNGNPKLILANTIKGEGISFMENNISRHYCIPQGEEYEVAAKELEE